MTEDTIALQSALSNLSSGDTFEVPGRQYVVEGEITSPQSGITINYGSATFQQTKEYSRTFVFPEAKDVTVLGGTGIGLGVEHLGTRTSFNNVAFLYFDRDCSNIRLENITARNHAGGSIRWGGGTMRGLKARGCTLAGVGPKGGIKPGDNNDDVAIGSYTSEGDHDCLIEGNEMFDHCFGAYLARGKGSKVSDNSFHDLWQHGGYFSQMSDFTLNDNTARDCAQTGFKNQISGDGLVARDIRVAGNLVSRCQTGLDVSVATGSVDSYFEKVTLSENQILDSTSGYGIGTDGVRGCTARDNEIIGNGVTGAYGLYFSNSSGRVVGNLLKRLQWSAIFGSLSGDSTFRDNEIEDAVMNVAKLSDKNRFRYLVQLSKSPSALTNPKYRERDNTYQFSGAEPSIFAGFAGSVWRFGSGVSTYIRAPWNFTSKRSPVFDTASDMKVFQA